MMMSKSDRRLGASGLTYGILVGLVAVVAISAITASGSGVNRLFGRVSDELRGIRLPAAAPSPTVPVGLYAFTTHSFTPFGATGRFGPTLANCQTSYASASWAQNTSFFNITTAATQGQGYQRWIVPQTGTYRIRALGAASGGGGSGADLQAEFALTRGEEIVMVVGQMSADANGGGGGSFVSRGGSTPLIVAGGGAGLYNGFSSSGERTATFLVDWCATDCGTPPNFTCGNRTGGVGGCGYDGGPGGGFFAAGSCSRTGNCEAAIGQGFNTTAIGGTTSSDGGFGGGGAYHSGANGAGGGGGYNGGRGGHSSNISAFGGTSFVATGATNRVNNGTNNTHGSITITRLN